MEYESKNTDLKGISIPYSVPAQGEEDNHCFVKCCDVPTANIKPQVPDIEPVFIPEQEPLFFPTCLVKNEISDYTNNYVLNYLDYIIDYIDKEIENKLKKEYKPSIQVCLLEDLEPWEDEDSRSIAKAIVMEGTADIPNRKVEYAASGTEIFVAGAFFQTGITVPACQRVQAVWDKHVGKDGMYVIDNGAVADKSYCCGSSSGNNECEDDECEDWGIWISSSCEAGCIVVSITARPSDEEEQYDEDEVRLDFLGFEHTYPSRTEAINRIKVLSEEEADIFAHACHKLDLLYMDPVATCCDDDDPNTVLTWTVTGYVTVVSEEDIPDVELIKYEGAFEHYEYPCNFECNENVFYYYIDYKNTTCRSKTDITEDTVTNIWLGPENPPEVSDPDDPDDYYYMKYYSNFFKYFKAFDYEGDEAIDGGYDPCSATYPVLSIFSCDEEPEPICDWALQKVNPPAYISISSAGLFLTEEMTPDHGTFEYTKYVNCKNRKK